MSRCGCASDRCSCHFIAGDNVSVSGTGTRSNPYVFQVILPAEAGGTGGGGVSVDWDPGDIKATGRTSASPGWLMCDGSDVERGAFPDLYAAIGLRYGPGNGTSTFTLPNFNGKVALGASSGKPLGTSGGSNSTTIELRHLPQHSHSMNHTHTINHDHSMQSAGNHDHTLDYSVNTGGAQTNVPQGTTSKSGTNRAAVAADGSHTHNIDAHNGNSGASSNSNTGNTGSASPDSLDTTPPYTTVNYVIKT